MIDNHQQVPQNNYYSDVVIRTLPPDVRPYEHQISGHGMENLSKRGRRILKGTSVENNEVYKHMQGGERGKREAAFYIQVFSANSTEPTFFKLKDFIPTFKGVFKDPLCDEQYICLEDALYHFQYPCVIDVKMGTISYEPSAPEDKKAIESAKFVYRKQVGFMISGMKVYDVECKKQILYDSVYGRKLSPEEVYTQGIQIFLSSAKTPTRQRKLCRQFIDRLNDLKIWFTTLNNGMEFYGSSLLLAYNAYPCHQIQDCNNTCINEEKVSNGEVSNGSREEDNDERVIVKWVDFAHVVYSGSSTTDSNTGPHCNATAPSTTSQRHLDINFLIGLDNLIQYLERGLL